MTNRYQGHGLSLQVIPCTEPNKAIVDAAITYGLEIDFRRHGAKFRTVYLSACSTLPRVEQASRLKAAYDRLRPLIHCIRLTVYSNPIHPRNRDPLIEMDSIWWEE